MFKFFPCLISTEVKQVSDIELVNDIESNSVNQVSIVHFSYNKKSII